MKVFIWEDLDQLTIGEHRGGGATVVADTPERAAQILELAVDELRRKSVWYDRRHDDLRVDFSKAKLTVFTIEKCNIGDVKERVWIFPDAGCC